MYNKVKLDYNYDGLEPYIDAQSVEIHYTKHLQSYVNNLNNLLKGYDDFTKGKTLEEILKYPKNIPAKIRTGVINQGGGVANHNFYFSILSPSAKTKPEGKLLEAINKAFGSFEEFKEELSVASISQFGSGYGWLVINRKGRLEIIGTENQDSPLSLGMIPLINIDVWEHAYYLKYKNLRADYVKAIWNIIDFAKVEKIYEEAIGN
ncbi:MAG: superoxide dismutase [Clostridium sp.]